MPSVQIEWAALCEDAVVGEFGTATLTNAGVRFVTTEGLPARSQACLALRLIADEGELGRDIALELRLKDPDKSEQSLGSGVLRAFGPEDPSLIPASRQVGLFEVIRPALAFRKAGDHSIEIYVEGRHEFSVPFRVVTS